MIDARIAAGRTFATRLAARAEALARARAEAALRARRDDPARWRKAHLLWPLFTRER
jgi:hypothetical protein